jgi:hypothetical protein
MGISDILNKWREKKSIERAKFKDAEEERKIERILNEREKSANRRELERFMHEKEEEAIKYELESFRKERQEDIEFGHQIINTKNIFKGQKKLFTNKPTMKDKSVIKSKKLFFR